MPLFTFYPTHTDGSASMFEAHYLPNEAAAARMAHLVLEQHSSGDHVVVWCDDRLVFTRGRSRGRHLSAMPARAQACAR
jgi:hypothetical protein